MTTQYVLRIGSLYFSARRGYFGGLVRRCDATLFSRSDAESRAADIVGCVAVPA